MEERIDLTDSFIKSGLDVETFNKISNIIRKYQKYQLRWNKLKESINDFKQQDDTTDDDTAGLWFVIDKMQELEKDDE